MGRGPSRSALEAARDHFLPDVLGPELAILFVGINPSLYSTAVGHHFARPGNRFWPALHGAGLTDRQLDPSEDAVLPRYGAGLTNMVARTTARADELAREEIVAGVSVLEDKVQACQPNVVAVVGLTAYRTGFGDRTAAIGPQAQRLAGSQIWALPNPSGLNAHYQLPQLVELYAALVTAATR